MDIEEGLDVSHEDLVHVRLYDQPPNHYHGTMSLGVCCAHGADKKGVRGIAYRADAHFALVQRKWPADQPSYPLTSVAIRQVVDDGLPAGSVILLEVHASYSSSTLPTYYDGSLFPVELAPDVRWAIEYAAARNIYVVEAAGNGNVDLDHAGVTCSTSAILAGGGEPGTRRWVCGTNFGNRIDCHGWGQCVVTTGALNQAGASWHDNLQRDLRPGGATRCYTQSFDGTSSGAAIVAGVVACLLGIVKANGLPWPTPWYLKDLIRETGTPQAANAKQKIGPLPDLSAAIARLESDSGVQLRKWDGPVP